MLKQVANFILSRSTYIGSVRLALSLPAALRQVILSSRCLPVKRITRWADPWEEHVPGKRLQGNRWDGG